MPGVARTLLYGLFAAASPIVLLATLVVVGSGRGRANGTAFTLAFLLGQSVAFLGAFFVGSALTESEHRTATSYIELAAGVALLVTRFAGGHLTSRRKEAARRGPRRCSRGWNVSRREFPSGSGFPWASV